MATIDDFIALDMRVGTVIEASYLEGARKPAIKLCIDFGETIGKKYSSAQITKRYTPDELLQTQVIAIVNFPPRRIAGFKSEVLVIGGMPTEDDVVLLRPDAHVDNGVKIG